MKITILTILLVSASSELTHAAEISVRPKDADRVLVIRNENSPTSRGIADDYAKRRGIHNLLSIRCQDSALISSNETIAFTAYLRDIDKPIRDYLGAHANIDFIVLTKGIPIRISAAPQGAWDNRLSLDNYIAAMDYAKLPGADSISMKDGNFHGTAWVNRFWNSSEPFTHAKFGGYLVTRLDGYTETDAKALTTNAIAAEQRAGSPPKGSAILLDTCPAFGYANPTNQPLPLIAMPPTPEGKSTVKELDFCEFNADMQHAYDILMSRKALVELTKTNIFIGNRTGLIGYVSWGSNDKHYNADAYHSLRFVPGAICDTAVSTSARTFLPTHGGQSLIADLIAQGITGIKGYTDEPLLQALASPSILFDRYTKGWTLAESFYAASRFVGWEDIVIGDPLCRPYRTR